MGTADDPRAWAPQEGRRADQRRAGRLDRRGLAGHLVEAAEEVVAGELDAHFPLVVFQTGSRHPEQHERQRGRRQPRDRAARRRAGREVPVHPNDDVNTASRATTPSPPRCTWPSSSAGRAAAPGGRRAGDGAGGQGRASSATSSRWAHPPAGRDAGDARPGDRRLGGAAPRRAGRRRYARRRARALAIGGTAVGTGLNAHPRVRAAAWRRICRSRRAARSSRPATSSCSPSRTTRWWPCQPPLRTLAVR